MSALGWSIGLGLLALGGVALVSSSKSSSGTPPAPSNNPTTPTANALTTYNFFAGHRYLVTVGTSGASLPSVTVAQVLAALQNVVQVPGPPAGQPAGAAGNLVSYTLPGTSSANLLLLTLDVFVNGTDTAGSFAAIVTGSDTSMTLPGGQGSVTVLVVDQGATQPPYGQSSTTGCTLPAGGVLATFGDQTTVSVPVFSTVQFTYDEGQILGQVTGYTSSDTTGTILSPMPGCPSGSGLFSSGSAGTATVTATVVDAYGNPQPSVTMTVVVGGS
jgi:hypothetical protein